MKDPLIIFAAFVVPMVLCALGLWLIDYGCSKFRRKHSSPPECK